MDGPADRIGEASVDGHGDTLHVDRDAGLVVGDGAVDGAADQDAGTGDVRDAGGDAGDVREEWLEVTALGAGSSFSCALLASGQIKCWGMNDYGQLGYGDAVSRGRDLVHLGFRLPTLDLGTDMLATGLAAGRFHGCALLNSGVVRCWGSNQNGQLGRGDNEESVGDESGEMGDALVGVPLEDRAVAIAGGAQHTCAVLRSGDFSCWGFNNSGQLGLGHTENVGDAPFQPGASVPALHFPHPVVEVSTGSLHTCVRLTDGTARCWGENSEGQLGLGDTNDRCGQDGLLAPALPPIVFSATGPVTAIAAGGDSSCAIVDTPDDPHVECWGNNTKGQLGLGDNQLRKLPARVSLGEGRPVAVALGGYHACALLQAAADDTLVKCWGDGAFGQLGLGDEAPRGDEAREMGVRLPAVELGGEPASLALGLLHSCALLAGARARCWGNNSDGELGIGTNTSCGDDPGEMGEDLPFADVGGCTSAALDPDQPAVAAPDFTPCGFAPALSFDLDYKICSGGSCVMPGCGDASCNAPGPQWAPPDTGQDQCWVPAGGSWVTATCRHLDPDGCGDPVEPWCGQDAEYGRTDQAGRFEVTPVDVDGTIQPYVTDTYTQLGWQGCRAGMHGADCSLQDEEGVDGSMNWQVGLRHCSELHWAGFDDWRLPSVHELQSLSWMGPAASEPVLFPPTGTEHYWSADREDGDGAWAVCHRNGQVFSKDLAQPTHVRCVRGGPAPRLGDRFEQISVEPAVVRDAVTGLSWTGCPIGGENEACADSSPLRAMSESLQRCEQLSWGGKSDWRLPSFNELLSIADTTTGGRLSLGLESSPWPSTSAYFSSTTVFNVPSSAMTWSADGTNFSNKVSRRHHTICVRDSD